MARHASRKLKPSLHEKGAASKHSKKKPQSRKATVEDDLNDSDDRDELAEEHRHLGNSSRSHKFNSEKLLNDLEVAAAYFSFDEHGGDDAEIIDKIEEQCGTIAKLLRARRGDLKSNKESKQPGTFASFDRFYIFRDGLSRIELLAPVEIFQANGSVKGKVFGFIRRAGGYFPLMCSISGSKVRVPAHPKLLDNEIWSSLVFSLGGEYGHHFRTNGYEVHRNAAKGTDFASHIEPKLMLWFVCHVFTQFIGTALPPEDQIKQSWKLHKLKEQITAEIVLDREPCECCMKFQEMIEIITRLKFEFKIIPNLGKMYFGKDKHGNANNYLPPVEITREAEFGEVDEAPMQIVIPENRTKSSTTTMRDEPQHRRHHHHHRHHQPNRPSSSTAQYSTELTVQSESTFQRFHHIPKNGEAKQAKSRKYQPETEDDESDWESSNRKARPKARTVQPMTPRSTAFSNSLPTPVPSPFPIEVFQAAKRLRKEKRKAERSAEASPTASKKARNTRFL